MKITVKNLIGCPYDVETLNGPAVLPAFGDLTAEFSPLQIELFKHSLGVEIVTASAPAKQAPVEPDNSAEMDQLRQIATALGIEVKESWSARRLQSKIDAVLKKAAD